MKKQIFRAFYKLIILTVILSSFVAAAITQRHSFAAFSAEIENEAKFASEGYNFSGESFLRIFTGNKNRTTLFSPDGTVLFDSKNSGAFVFGKTVKDKIAKNGSAKVTQSSVKRNTHTHFVLLDDGNILAISGSFENVYLKILTPTLLLTALGLMFAHALSEKTAKRIASPINEIDLDNPLKATDGVYKDIAPLLNKINDQSRRMDEQLYQMRIRQQEFSTITENMREGFVIIDRNENILSYNSSALHLFGVEDTDKKEAIQKLKSSESFKEAAKTALNADHNESYISYNDRRYLLISNPVTNNSEVIGAIIIILDVTEKEERDNLRREFTANVSHELKTPLTSISGFAEILKNGLVRNEDVVRFAENIYDEAQRMITLIRDIMKLSQLDEDAFPIEKEPVDIYEVSLSVLERMKPSAEKNNVTLEIQGTHATVIGGVQILDEMIFNLVDNAIKYNKPGGKVILSVTKGKGFVRLSVEDTGIGIPQSDRERVFERFYRVDKSHSKDIGGTGLGLSIVKHGAIYHNAKVELKSELGKGTTVTLTFNVTE